MRVYWSKARYYLTFVPSVKFICAPFIKINNICCTTSGVTTLPLKINRYVIQTNVQYGQNGVNGQPARQHVVVVKLKELESVFCQTEQEVLPCIVRVKQRRKTRVMRINAQVRTNVL